jgi:hypothetical protein
MKNCQLINNLMNHRILEEGLIMITPIITTHILITHTTHLITPMIVIVTMFAMIIIIVMTIANIATIATMTTIATIATITTVTTTVIASLILIPLQKTLLHLLIRE